MSTASVYLVAGATTYYLNNSTGFPVAGGALTSASTTPLAVEWPWDFPIAPPSLAGVYETTPVSMTIPLVCVGTTIATLWDVIETLRRAFTTLSGISPYLVFRADSTVNPVYYTFDVRTVQVLERSIDQTKAVLGGALEVRLLITVQRSPYGASLHDGFITAPQISMDTQNYANLGTGSPDNIVALSAAGGDFLTLGSPLNYTLTPTNAGAGDPIRSVFLASVITRTYGTPTTGSWSTSGTTFDTGTSATLTAALSAADLLTNPHLKFRIFVRASSITGSPEFRFKVYLASANTGVIFTGPINALQVIDSGRIPITLDPLRELNDTNIGVQMQVRSTDGASTTGTINNFEALFYYEACEVKFPRAANAAWATGAGTNYEMHLSSFAEKSGYPLVPLVTPQAFLSNPSSSDALVDWGSVRGVVPLLRSSTSLYAMLRDASSATNCEQGRFAWTSTRTFTVTATHSPIFRTLRGAN